MMQMWTKTRTVNMGGEGLWDQLQLVFKVRKWGNWVGVSDE